MPPRILIAEDDELQGAVMQSALEKRGYEAEIVTDGLQAVRRLRTGQYDLALLDYHLPEVDGLAAARLLHDHFSGADRPGLIAVTAMAEGLCEKEGASGGTSFDAVVSKGVGLPALLTVVEASLTSAAERQAAVMVARGREAVRAASALRRRHWLAPLAAIPALAMVTAFAAAFAWGVASLSGVDAVMGSARRTAALTTNAAALIGAVQDAEISQRTYLATGLEAHRAGFESDAQHVDQMLVSSAPLSADGAPGFDPALEPQAVIAPRLSQLAQEAQSRQAMAVTGAVPALGTSDGREAAEMLRGWASRLVTGSQRAVFAGLEAIRQMIVPVLWILAAGILYGSWNAIRAVQLRWHGPNPAQPSPAIARRLPPARPPITAWAWTPLSGSQGD